MHRSYIRRPLRLPSTLLYQLWSAMGGGKLRPYRMKHFPRHQPRQSRDGPDCGRAHGLFFVPCLLLLLWIFFSASGFFKRRENVVSDEWKSIWFAAAEEIHSSSASCDGTQQPRPGAIYSAVGHIDYGVGLELKADLSISGECEANLPIAVPARELGIDSSLGIPVVEVTSPEQDASYGAGSEITIDIRFSSTVHVSGSPTVRLRTGCHSDTCRIPETQSFFCKASRGKFAISFNGETIPNVDAGTTEEGLKRILQDFSGVERTSVQFSIPAIVRERSGWNNNGVCSSNGTFVTVTFESVSLEGSDGDLPMLELDYLNSPVNSFTGMSWGDDNRLWYGWLNEEESEPERAEKDLSFGGYHRDDLGKVIIADDGLNGVELGPSIETKTGWKPADRLATYTRGSGTDTLSFLYTVREGDSSEDLDYYDESSLTLPDNATITGDNAVRANLDLPPLGYAAVYRLGTGSSIGANKGIVIDTIPPVIVQVESPNEARAYGTGEVIVIVVVFNQEVVISGYATLRLETGVFNQEIELVSSSSKTLTFEYVIQEGDSTSDLDYASPAALNLNGGSLHRRSETSTTEAFTILPEPGEYGSLSYNEDIVVRATTASIIDVSSSTADGEYGVGQDIYINVTFGWWDDEVTPMFLIADSAELWLRAGWRVRAIVHGAVNNTTQLVLEEGHELGIDDVGHTISVGVKELTLLSLAGNEIEVSEPYVGQDVLEGTPAINVSSSGYQAAAYSVGNGTAHFEFLYTVQPGDHSINLEYWDINAFKTDGFVRRAGEQGAKAANVSLPEPGVCVTFKGCSLGANRDIVVSTNIPYVTNITTTKPPGRGPYGRGDDIDVTVWFTDPIDVLENVTSVPRLRMNTGAFADHAFGSGTKAITFVYTIQEGDSADALDTWNAPAYGELSALDVRYASNVGYLRRASTSPTTDADLTLPEPGSPGSLSDRVTVVVDTSVARAVAVNTSTSLTNLTCGVGDEIPVLVTFTASVGLNSGGTAFYEGGNGTSVLRFLYTVGEREYSPKLDIAVAAADVTATTTIASPAHGAVYDSDRQTPAVVTLPKPGRDGSLGDGVNITIDTEPPRVNNVTCSLADGHYGAGQKVEISIEYNAPVVVIGLPWLQLDLGDTNGYAEFDAMADALNRTLLFSFIVREGDATADLDYTSPFALKSPNNHTTDASRINQPAILRSSTNPSQNASLILPANGQAGSLGDNSNIWIETARPWVQRISTTATDGVPRGVAARSQTIDVYASSQIVSGGFRLAYGDGTSIATACIPANSTALTADVLGDALSSANEFLNVTVREDDPPFDGARRFVVYYDAPKIGVGALSIDDNGNCEPLLCEMKADDDFDEGETGCDFSGVTIDKDASVPLQEGAIEVVLHFSAPIHINTSDGSPLLALRVDPRTTNITSASSAAMDTADVGVRYAEHVSGRTQFVDIGVGASRPITKGHFRLGYGGAVTECIDVNSAESAAGGYSVHSRLEELDEVNLLGVVGVTSEARGNGVRLSIAFQAGNPKGIEVPADNFTEGCLVDFDPPLQSTDASIPDTQRLSFIYVLQPGDTADSLEIAGAEALILNSSTIQRASTYPQQDANITLRSGRNRGEGEEFERMTTGLSGFSLIGDNDSASRVVIDCSGSPAVDSVASTAFAGEYGAGQRVYFQVGFSQAVIVDSSGSPELLLETGMTDRVATFYTGNGTSVLTFRSTIQEGDSTASLRPYSRTSLTRNGGFIRSASFQAFVDANLKLPSRSDNYSADGGAIVIDTSAPQVTSVYTSKDDHVYGEGEEIVLKVVYTHAIDVLGTPVIALNTGGEARFTLGGRNQFVSVSGDDDADFAFGAAQVTAGSFRLQYEDEITDCIGFNSSEDAASALRKLTAFSEGGFDDVTVSASRGGYKFEVTFSAGDGAFEQYPSALEVPWNHFEGCEAFLPTNAKPARVFPNTLLFLYQVAESDSSFLLDIENDTHVTIDESSHVRRQQSSSVTDGNTSLPDEPLRTSGSNIVVNTARPVVTGVHGANGNGPFGYNDEVGIRIDFSLPVTVTDTITADELPSLSLVVGSTSTAKTITYLTAAAVYSTAAMSDDANHTSLSSNKTSMYFKYLVGANDGSTDLRYFSTSSLTGNLLRLSSNPLTLVDLTLPRAGRNRSLSYNNDVVVNAADQGTYLHNVTRTPSSGTFGIGDEIELMLHFTRKVRFTGAEPTLQLATAAPFDLVGCTSPPAGYFADSFSFLYVVSPGDATSDLSYTDAYALRKTNSTEIVDEAGLTANITLPVVGSPLSVTGGEEWTAEGALVVDTLNIVLYATAINDNGVYYAGHSIFIQVVYNNDVVVFGTPLLTVRVGDAPYYNRRATYISGSGTPALIFEYIVEVGDHTIHLDYDGTNALFLPTATEAMGAAVRSKYDEAVDADPTLPAVWSPDTLGARSSIRIAGDVTPTVVSVSAPGTRNGTYGVGEVIDMEVLFTTRVYVKDSFSLPYLLVEVGNERSGDAQATYLSGNMTDTLTFRYAVMAADATDAFDILNTATSRYERFSTALVRPPAAEIKAASDRPSVDALLFLALPGTGATISYDKTIVLDTKAPYVNYVVVDSGDGVYGTGDIVVLVCRFTQPVVVVGEEMGTPSIGLSLGSSGHNTRAMFSGGNGTDTFEFEYTVQYGDYTELLDYESADSFLLFQTWKQSMERSGAAIKRASTIPSQDADLTLAPPGDPLTVLGKFSIVAMNSRVAVQTGNVRAIGARSTIPDGTYPEGSVIPVLVMFSVEVFVIYGMPSLALSISGNDSIVSTVLSGISPWGDNSTSVSYANYTSGNGTSELLLAYTIQPGDVTDRLDYAAPSRNALSAPFGSIVAKDTLEPVYIRSLPEPGAEGSLGWNNEIVISDEVLLVEQLWTTAANGTYGAGERIDIYVGFRFPILLESRTAFLTINTVDGGFPVELSGQNSIANALTFGYTVRDGQETASLEVTSPSAFNGTVRLNATYASSSINVTLPFTGEPGSLSYGRDVSIDTGIPYIVSVTSNLPNGTYTIGAVIEATVHFNYPVVVVVSGANTRSCNTSSDSDSGSSGVASCGGLPALKLDVSGMNGDKDAIFVKGNGSNELVFEYEVQNGDGSSRLDYTSTTALSEGTSQILRASTTPSTPAALTLPAKGAVGSLAWSSELVVDSTALYISNVNSSKPDGTYSVGEEIYIDVYMSSPVEITGTPLLELNAGVDAVATYVFGGRGDGVLSFLYTILEGEATQDLDTRGQNSLMIPDGAVMESVDNARAPMILILSTVEGGQGSLGTFKQLVIDTSPPNVLDIASSKRNAEYGAGEEIDVTVSFDYPVAVTAEAHILLDVGDGRLPGEAMYLYGNRTSAVTFLYTVQDGDHSVDLGTYEGGATGGGGGLRGTVLRDSDTPTQVANTEIPLSGEDGSLRVNNDIAIDTTPPHVIAVLSLREGVYTTGQSVDIQVIYNKQVNVTGTPRVMFALDSANGTEEETYAYYDASFDTGSFAYEDRALSFVYVVRDGDEMIHLKHAGSDALELFNNATIRRASTHPTTNALINLPESDEGSLLDLVTKTEVVVRGLYHAYAADLEITLLHQEHSCVLSAATDDDIGGRPSGEQFGIPEDRRYIHGFGSNPVLSTGMPSKPAYRHRGIGYDYAFADVVGENVAAHEQAISRQSSTMFGGVSGGAVDGNPSRFFSDGSTTMTTLEAEPWWQVTLADSYTLGFIRLFGQEEEVVKREIQTVTVRSKTALGGSFTLNVTDSKGKSSLTGDIYYNAVGSLGDEAGNRTGTGSGESFESKLEELSSISSVEVTRSSSSSSAELSQRTWTITFVDPLGDMPILGLGSDEGLTSYGNMFTFATIRDGTAAGGVYVDGVSQIINAVHGPSWVMVFESAEAATGLKSVEQAKAAANYSVYVPDNEPVVNIPIAGGVTGSVIRVQLEGTGYLSISELQAYELSFLPLSKSSRSNPVPAREEWDPIQAEGSLNAAFAGTAVSGVWILRLRDTKEKELNTGIGRAAIREAHGDGGVAGWELVVTDFFGTVFRFTTDSLITIETLPKFGRIFAASTAEEAEAAALAGAAIAAEANIDSTTTRASAPPTLIGSNANAAYEITVADGFDRHLGPCHAVGGGDRGDPSRRCPETFGVGPKLSTRALGAVAMRNRVHTAAGGGAKLWYVPEEGYLGPDDLSYSVTVGGIKSAEAWVAGVHTRRCRLFEEGEAHALCVCGSPVIQVEREQQVRCHLAVEGVCASQLSGLGGNKTDSNSRLNNKIKVRMCKACEVTFQRHITSTPTSYSEYTSECLAETAKVGNWLLAQGYCQDSYTFPICDNEAFDPVGAVLEGPKLGVARSFRLQELGSRQTDRTDFKHRASSSASGGGECRCTQGPEVCSCRDNAWAQRRGG